MQPQRNTQGIKVDFSTGGSASDEALRNEELLFSAALNRPKVCPTFRKYDAVGPEVITMLELLELFAKFQGRRSFRPVHIGYDNMENILNIVSFGNLNRQFLSLLRSEQESHCSYIGNYKVWENLLGPDAKLLTLNEAFDGVVEQKTSRNFPFWTTAKLVLKNPSVIYPGAKLSLEILNSYFNPLTISRNPPSVN